MFSVGTIVFVVIACVLCMVGTSLVSLVVHSHFYAGCSGPC